MSARRPLPCHRCGHVPASIKRNGKTYVHCSICMFSGPSRPTNDEAVQAWDDIVKAEAK